MGYYYHYLNSDIKIRANNILAASGLLREYMASQYPDSVVLAIVDASEFIKEAAHEHQWYLDTNSDGDIVDPSFDEIKGSPRLEWLNTIAPYVESGSYVEICNDDNETYREVWIHGKPSLRVHPRWPSVEEMEKESD